MYVNLRANAFCLAKNVILRKLSSRYDVARLTELGEKLNYDPPLNSTLLNLERGWVLSHKLIDTPYRPLRSWLNIDRYISKSLTTYYIKGNNLVYKVGTGDERITEPLVNLNIDLEIYSFYIREGYRVIELEGTGYRVIEPRGLDYFIDLTRCNCIDYIETNNCLHLKLANIHHKHRTVINATKEIDYIEHI